MKIGIIGNYGATNIGDDAILTAMLKSFSSFDVTVFSANPEKTHNQFGVKSVSLFPFGVRSIIKYGFLDSIKAIKKVDIVVLGGGGLFQDNYLYACFLWAWQVFLVKMLKKPIVIYGTGVGPLNTIIGKKITKWAYSQAKVIMVRDHMSHKLLSEIGIPKKNIHITADPAFIYNKVDMNKDRTKNLFIISLRPWLKYNTKIINSFTDFLANLKKEKNAEFIFVSMQKIRECDRRVIDPVIKKIGGEYYIPPNFTDLLRIMQTAEFAIGMRYHFLIAAMITQTPVLPVSYSTKIDELFNNSPLKTYEIQVKDLSAEKLNNNLKRLSVDYNNVKIYEKTRLNNLRELAHKNIDLFNEFIKPLT